MAIWCHSVEAGKEKLIEYDGRELAPGSKLPEREEPIQCTEISRYNKTQFCAYDPVANGSVCVYTTIKI